MMAPNEEELSTPDPFGHRFYRIALVSVIVVSFVLRILLALVNREANDDHIEVARMILNEHRLPDKEECAECFQPKLYHAATALLFALFPNATEESQITIANIANSVLGMLTILVIWRFAERLPVQRHIKFLAVSLTAMNPSLIGINAQATNDTLVIFCGVLTAYNAHLFLIDKKAYRIFLFTLSALLAITTKGNGLVAVAAVVMALGILSHLLVRSRTGANLFVPAFVCFLLVVPFAAVLNPLTQYRHNLERYGSINVLAQTRPEFPQFFQKTYTAMAGVRSIADSFFTFRLMNMIAYPCINESDDSYPLHRTSFWSQLFGRAHFIHYDAHPPSWATTDPVVLNIGRIILPLALIPTIVLLIGLASEIRFVFSHVMKTATFFAETQGWFLVLFFAGYLAFAILYSLFFRESGTMKAIVLYPALLTFPYFFAKGFGLIETKLRNHYVVSRMLVVVIFIVISFYLFDVSSLIIHLHKLRFAT